ncbi:hypothetical protein [Vibrio mediterranei]|jgi:hypothetical protein|uniref:hypothetical protein n=1 Tax=Vibrio mediterranei TaxID=689 RepID=UPI0007F3AEFA|nr:hypothetical protein [Vibrio mediterranei]MCG9660991.1 hypothetical protein [Vibrio mediterranei]MCG9664878.1 hypothetical protein [Vibrio mediterranei]SBO11429.1 hypothetical protein VME0621_03565 [Vibrio mediterranei]
MIIFTVDSFKEVFHIHTSMKINQFSTQYFNDGHKLHKLKRVSVKKDVFDVSGMYHEVITGCTFEFYSRSDIKVKIVEGEFHVEDIELSRQTTTDYGVCTSASEFCF